MSTVAAVQMTSGPEVAANLARAGELVAAAADQGARLVVLPENFAHLPAREADRRAAAEGEGRGPIQDFLADRAARHRIWLVGGTVPLATGGARVRAACLVFDPSGTRVARYDKIHLFDAQVADGERYLESRHTEPGEQPVLVETDLGRLGLAVCYDLRFPELFRRLAAQGAALFAVPAAFTVPTGRAHWKVLVRARAVENTAYLVAAAQWGRHAGGRRTYGHSAIVDPWGMVVAGLAEGEGVAAARLDPARQADIRRWLPVLDHRRLE